MPKPKIGDTRPGSPPAPKRRPRKRASVPGESETETGEPLRDSDLEPDDDDASPAAGEAWAPA